MARNLHDIDRIFSDAQEGFGEPPPPAAWDKIQAALDRKDAEKYRARFVWWKRVAVVMMVLFCLAITLQIVHKPVGVSTGIAKKKRALRPVTAKVLPADNNKVNNLAYNTPNIANAGKVAGRQATANDYGVKNTIKAQHLEKNAGEHRANREGQDGIVIKGAQLLYLHAAYGGITPVTDTWVPGNRSIAVQPVDAHLPLLPQAGVSEHAGIKKKHRTEKGCIQFAGFYVSADISQYMLDNDVAEGQRGNETDRDEINHRERHEPSFTVGVFAEKPLSIHAGIKAGLAYAKTAITIAPQQLVAIKQNGLVGYKYITSSGYALVQPNGAAPAVGDSATTAEAQHRLDVVSVPVSFYYRFTKGRFIVSPSAGLSVNFITAARVQTEISNRGTKESVYINRLEGSRWFYAGAQLEADIRYRIARNWHIGVTPSLRCAFTAITKNNAVKTFPYTVGVAGSLVYKF